MAKILIIEDDKKLRTELKIFLEKNGYQVSILEEFKNPIENILKENADLILLDINLPYIDGEYICKELRKTSDIPIIIVTSRDNEIDELISLNNGADQYVTKPYNIHILLAKISRLLARSNAIGVDQEKIDCEIKDIEQGEKLLKAIGYKEIMTIKEKDVVYSKEEFNIAIKSVLDGDNLIEIETVDDNKELDTVKKLEQKIRELDIPIDESDFFVKKAEIKLKKILGG